jgi:D-3-phosphoglycerate dehydrogenase
MVRIAATFPTDNVEDEEEAAALGVRLEQVQWSDVVDLAAALRMADIVVTRQTVPLTASVIAAMERCVLIHNVGTGHSGLDISAASRSGIWVSHPGDFCTEEVAEHTVALILASVRKIVRLDTGSRAGLWLGYRKPGIASIRKPMFRVRGSTLGLVGLGRIGRRVSALARGLGFEVIAYSPSVPTNTFAEVGVGRVGLEDLLRRSDVVALTGVPRPDRRCLIGSAEFDRMKPTAYLVNCAHGSLVDEEALYRALRDGVIAGAAIDVLTDEALLPGNRLADLDNIVFTASTAGYSETSYSEMRRRTWDAIRRVLSGARPEVLLNPEIERRVLRRMPRAG